LYLKRGRSSLTKKRLKRKIHGEAPSEANGESNTELEVFADEESIETCPSEFPPRLVWEYAGAC
jgi:hypothetical protein